MQTGKRCLSVARKASPRNEVLTTRGFLEMAASGFLGEISHVREDDRKKKVRNDLGDKDEEEAKRRADGPG